jgi:signal transduction histidine kinase
MQGRGIRWSLAVVGLTFAVASELIQIAHGARPERSMIDLAVGLTYLLGGLSAWGRQPANRTWKLMTGVGLAWFIGNLAASDVPLISAAGTVLADTDAILLVALVLAYPEGRVEGLADRVIVAFAAAGLTGANVVFLVTGVAAPALLLGLIVTGAVGIRIPIRWYQAPRARRRALGPPLLAVLVTIAAVAVAIVARLLGVGEDAASALLSARDIGVLAIPIGFVVGSFQLVEDELIASRARIVAAADEARRRLERDLHDGAQQRFVAVSVALRIVRSRLGPGIDPRVAEGLDAATNELRAGIADLRELARGLHPAVLTDEGLAGALPALADRSTVPTRIVGMPDCRLPAPVEATAYFVVSEALTNAGRHSRATEASLRARIANGVLRVDVADDGIGGADISAGTGLAGLVDRVEALGGDLRVVSPPGGGTLVSATIPLAGTGDLEVVG